MAKVTPFRPSRHEPWDARKARHLLNRAGFGGSPEEIDAIVKQGFADAVHRIIYYDPIPNPLGPPPWLDQPIDTPALPDLAELRRQRRAGAQTPPNAAAPGAGAPATPDAAGAAGTGPAMEAET